jgi:hypothetical protein
MQKLKRFVQIIGHGLIAALCGGLVGGVVGSLSFGLPYMFFLWSFGQEIITMPFLQSNTWFGFYLGNNLGIAAGAMAWFWPGLMRAARQLVFPWRRMIQCTFTGAVMGLFIAALNACLILLYAAKTAALTTPFTLEQFLGMRSLPHRIGPFISRELPFFMMILGLLLGVFIGAWWGTRPARRKEGEPLPVSGVVVPEPV